MTVLERDHPEPLYRRLMADLQERISSGELQPAQKLPSYRELERIYGVSSIVVRQALGELQRQGQVFSVAGRGTFVTVRKVSKRLQALTGFTEDMRRQGMVASSVVLRKELVAADRDLAEKVCVPEGTEVALLERIRLGDGLPMCVQTSYLVHSLCPRVLEHDFETTSLYEVLRVEYGILFGWSRLRIRATVAGEREIRLLQIPRSVALLWIDGCSYTTSEEPFEYGDTAYRADHYEVLSSMVNLPTDLVVQS